MHLTRESGATAGYALECCLNSCGLVHFQGSPGPDSALETCVAWDGRTHGWDAGDEKEALSFFRPAGHF